MKTLWEILKDTVATFTGLLSIIISFLLLSGIPVIVVGHMLNNAVIYGVGYGIFVFYLAPNGIAIFGFVVLAPLINKFIFRRKN